MLSLAETVSSLGLSRTVIAWASWTAGVALCDGAFTICGRIGANKGTFNPAKRAEQNRLACVRAGAGCAEEFSGSLHA